jgi:hypothetical protein
MGERTGPRAIAQNTPGMKWFAFVRDGENDEDRARVRVVSLGTDGTTVIDSIERGQGKRPIPKCAGGRLRRGHGGHVEHDRQ